jgi:hypothetical protein
MAMLLLLGAMAKQRNGSGFGQVLEKPQGEFLAVILDPLIPPIDPARLAQLGQITAAVFLPGYLPCEDRISQLLARAEVCHPNVETIAGQPPAPPARRQDPKTILSRFDFGVNGLGFEHQFPSVLAHDPDSAPDLASLANKIMIRSRIKRRKGEAPDRLEQARFDRFSCLK